MGLFDKLKKKSTKDKETECLDTSEIEGEIYAPIKGKYIPIQEIEDEVFSQRILGNGCGIRPEEGKVYAPVSGVITMIADTKHAVGICAENGAEFLIHVGMDTIDMNGDGFKVKVNVEDHIKAGQQLMSFDMEKIRNANHPTTTAFVLTNEDTMKSFEVKTGKVYSAGEQIGILEGREK